MCFGAYRKYPAPYLYKESKTATWEIIQAPALVQTLVLQYFSPGEGNSSENLRVLSEKHLSQFLLVLQRLQKMLTSDVFPRSFDNVGVLSLLKSLSPNPQIPNHV